MNQTILTGRLVWDPEVRWNERGFATAKFKIAVDRPKRKDEEQETDFIPCVTFGKTAEFLERNGFKGQLVAVCGRIQVTDYEKEGRKLTWTEVVADRVEALQWKEKRPQSGTDWPGEDGFVF